MACKQDILIYKAHFIFNRTIIKVHSLKEVKCFLVILAKKEAIIGHRDDCDKWSTFFFNCGATFKYVSVSKVILVSTYF